MEGGILLPKGVGLSDLWGFGNPRKIKSGKKEKKVGQFKFGSLSFFPQTGSD